MLKHAAIRVLIEESDMVSDAKAKLGKCRFVKSSRIRRRQSDQSGHCTVTAQGVQSSFTASPLLDCWPCLSLDLDGVGTT